VKLASPRNAEGGEGGGFSCVICYDQETDLIKVKCYLNT